MHVIILRGPLGKPMDVLRDRIRRVAGSERDLSDPAANTYSRAELIQRSRISSRIFRRCPTFKASEDIRPHKNPLKSFSFFFIVNDATQTPVSKDRKKLFIDCEDLEMLAPKEADTFRAEASSG